MSELAPKDQFFELQAAVARARPIPGHGPLIQTLNAASADFDLKLVYSRTGWHRPGGVVDSHGNRVAENLSEWLKREIDGDAMDLLVRYEDSGLLATKLCGITHYFTAKTGSEPCDFVQIEVDELREVTDRTLFDLSNPPDSIDELIDPVVPLKVDPTPLGPSSYHLRQAWDIAEAHQRMATSSYADSLLALRFVKDWQVSSASARAFCSAFVLRLLDYKDRFGEKRLQATPLSTHVRALPPFPGGTERGLDLARFLAAFDRAVGYPMAWYFHLASGAQPALEGVARAVHEDVSGVYDYLPERDIAVLKSWIDDPYMF
jgi:hypothetical protein